MRTFSAADVRSVTDEYAHELVGFHPEEWLQNHWNVALTNEYGDIALFERQWFKPNTVYGHYFFKSRGVRACRVAKEFLTEIFTGDYDVEAVLGITPYDKKGALRMNNYLGFKSLGPIETVVGPCELVTLTKQEWEQTNE